MMVTKVKMMLIQDVLANCERAASEGWSVRQIAVTKGQALVVFEKEMQSDTHEGVRR